MERVRSPLVTAVATSAMLRTWVVRLAASRFTLPVRSFQVPAAPGTLAWPRRLPAPPHSRLALGFDGEVLLEVAVGDGGHHLHDAAHLLGEVGRHDVDGVGEILPGAGDARHLRLAAELALGADLAGD